MRNWKGRRWVQYGCSSICLSLMIFGNLLAHAQSLHEPCQITLTSSIDKCIIAGESTTLNIGLFVDEVTGQTDWGKKLLVQDENGSVIIDIPVYLQANKTFIKSIPLTLYNSAKYSATYLDEGNGCEKSISIQFNVSPVYEIVKSDISCFGESDGIIEINAGSGQNLELNWEGDFTGDKIENLLPGIYQLTITNNGSCSVFESIRISEPEELALNINEASINCAGNTENILAGLVRGGKGPFQFDWDMDGTGDFDDEYFVSINDPGTYSLKVRDANNCEISISHTTFFSISHLLAAANATIISNELVDNEWARFDLKKSLDPENGDIDNNGMDGSFMKVSFHENHIDADQKLNELPLSYIAQDSSLVYARIESTLGCYDIGEVALRIAAQATLELVLDETCSHQPAILLSGGLPEGGTYSGVGVFQSTVDNQYYFEPPLDISQIYKITYTAPDGSQAMDNIAVQAVIFVAFVENSNICYGSPKVRIMKTPEIGGVVSGTGVALNPENGHYEFNPAGLDPGPYEILVTYEGVFDSGHSCDRNLVIQVNILPLPEVDIELSNDVVCLGDEIILTPNVNLNIPDVSFSYNWQGPNNFSSSDPTIFLDNAELLGEGSYIVTVTASNGCSATDDAFVDVVLPPDITCTVSSEVACAGDLNGMATVMLGPINPADVSFNWSNGETTQTATDLPGGMNSVIVTDMNGCETECTVIVDEPEPAVVDVTINSDVRCFGELTGSAIALVGGGNGGFNYLWSNGEMTALATELQFGVNSVTVTDSKGCTASESILINQPDEFICMAFQTKMVYCHGDYTGEANVTVSGGNGGNSFLWDNGETTATAIMLSAGMHSVTTTDALGCTTECSVLIEQPELLVASSNPPEIICYDTQDGIIDITVSGGTEPYKFDWDNDESGDFDDQEDLTNIGTGNYGITVMDGLGCMYSASFTIEDYNEIIINPNTFETCDEVSINLDGNPGGGSNPFTGHSWSIMMDNGTGITSDNLSNTNQQVLSVNTTGLTPGEVVFTYQATDSEGCQNETKITLNILPNPVATPQSLGVCTGEMTFIDGNASNGNTPIVSHFWEANNTNPGSAANVELAFADQATVKVNAMNASEGLYNLVYTAIDEKGCRIVEEIAVPIYLAPDAGSDAEVEVCNAEYPATVNFEDLIGPHDGSGSWNQTGGLSIDISNPFSVDFECRPAGLYTFTYTVNENDLCLPAMSTIEVNVIDCFDLALRKRVSVEQDYKPGMDVVFSIEVFNQGDVDAHEVTITDYIQEGFIFKPDKNTSALTGNDNDWLVSAENAELLIGDLPAYASKTAFIKLTIKSDFNGAFVSNIAEITYYTNGHKPFPPDEDEMNLPSTEQFEVDDDIEDDFNGGIDNPFDEDQLDEAIVPLCTSNTFACNDLVYISLDGSCETNITPDMVLEGEEEFLGNISVYIIDDEGNQYPPTITSSDIGTTIQVSVVNNCTLISCWGYVTVEDKFPPIIRCADDITLSCLDKEKEIEIQPFIQDCSNYNIVIISDKTVHLNCLDEEYPGMIAHRQIWYKAVDIYGNESEICSKNIYYKKTTLEDVQVPEDEQLSCSSHQTSDYSPSWDLNGNFYPDPNETGIPTINDVPLGIYNTELETIMSRQDFCTINLTFSDQRIDICDASFKIIREWFILDWCSSEVYIENQIIKVLDTEGPYLDCSSDFIEVVSADPFNCSLDNYLVPNVASVVLFDCSNYNYKVEYAYLGEACHLSLLAPSEYKKATGSGTNSRIPNLELGCTQIKYILTDDCGNVSTCIQLVKVEDRTAPFPVCDHHTILSLDSEGVGKIYAYSLDDGSIDNCSEVRFGVRRMDGLNCSLDNPPKDIVFSVGSTHYYEYEFFCCTDVGTTALQLELVVIDEADNYNFCMVDLELQDKFPPILTCPQPSSITLDCGSDYSVDALGSGEATFTAVCGVYSVDYVDNVVDLPCSEKNITRTWRLKNDNTGMVIGMCNQRIFIRNLTPVDLGLVQFPPDIENLDGCGEGVDLSPNNPLTGGYPIFPQSDCSLIASTYSDQIFRNIDGACLKILRKWTVIDWCTFDPDITNPEGIIEWVQFIKVNDHNPPVVNGVHNFTFLAVEDCAALVKLNVDVSDVCTPDQNLEFTYEFTSNGDGVFNETVTGQRSFERHLSIGTYSLRWMISDHCENTATFLQSFAVVDQKPPTPYCYSEIVSVIIQDKGNVAIWANDFDLGIEDNCSGDLVYFTFGPNNPLNFNTPHYYKPRPSGAGSISASESEFLQGNAEYWMPATKSSGKVFTCEDLGTNVLNIFVQDDKGNKDFCTVEFDVQDNNAYCNMPGGTAIVSGVVNSVSEKNMEDVQIRLENAVAEYGESLFTNEDGEYAFNPQITYGEYTLSAEYDGYYLDGVSTLDLILIQKHILDISRLTGRDKIVAADVNQNGVVSAIDLVSLRKLILGVIDEFPEGKAWKLVPKLDLEDESIDPHQISDKYKFDNLNPGINNIDFTGIKLGDVNNSSEKLHGENIEIRSDDQFIIEMEDKEILTSKEVRIPFIAGENAKLSGFQFTIDFDPALLLFKEIKASYIDISSDNIGLRYESNGLICLSWNENTAIQLMKGDILFELVFKGLTNANLSQVFKLNSKISIAEAYNEQLDIMPIEYRFTNSQEALNFELYQNSPNPFSESTIISFSIPASQRILLTITDLTGKAIYMHSDIFHEGVNEILINNEVLNNASGVLIYSLEGVQGKLSKSMLLIK